MRWIQRHPVPAVLAAFALAYLVGLDTHDVTNWQEGIRLLTAMDMSDRGDWIVPTIHGEPYLAKPPLIYWATLVAAEARSRLAGPPSPTLFDLRLVAALSGLLGIAATYWAGRVLWFDRDEQPDQGSTHPRELAHRMALWSAALAGTGVLFVRSSRIGELDVLLIPTVAGTVASCGHALLGRSVGERLAGVALALACSALAALAKGPAGLLVIGCAVPVGISVGAFFSDDPVARRARRVALAWGLTLACAGAGLGAVWLWSRAVAARIGPDAVAAAVSTESGENLRLLVPDAWLKYLEGMSYGAGLASLLTLLALWRLVTQRPPGRRRLGWGGWIVLAWVLASFVAFSLTTKGVVRYLTPVWPALGLLGGWWLVQRIDETRDRPREKPREFCLVVIVMLAVAQAVWYSYGREWGSSDRSFRAMARELLTIREADAPLVRPGLVGSYDLWQPGMEIALGVPVTPWAGPANTSDTPHTTPEPIETLAEGLRSGEYHRYLLLVRDGVEPGRPEAGLAIDQLEALGLEVTRVETEAAWTIDNGKTSVVPVVLSAPHSN
ncbi:MAG: ArnT family glycosyltransferase [Phycisphaerales bacterium JB040]